MNKQNLHDIYKKSSVIHLSETEMQELKVISKTDSKKVKLNLENLETLSFFERRLLAGLINKNFNDAKIYSHEKNNQILGPNKKSYTLTLQFSDQSTQDIEVQLTNCILKIDSTYYILKNYLKNTKSKGGFGSVKETIAIIELDENTCYIKPSLKIIKKQYISLNDPEASEEMVKREIKAIKKVYDYQPETLKRQAKKGSCNYFTMPKFSGNQLYEHTFNNNLNKKIIDLKKLTVAVNFLTALREIHDKGLIHLDVKPSNIMLNGVTGEVNIVDFGTTRKIGSDVRLSGTKEFIAPELSKNVISTATKSMDVFSAAGTCATIFSLSDRPRNWKEAIKNRSEAKTYQQRRNTPFNLEVVDQLSFSENSKFSIKNLLKYMGALDQSNRVRSLDQVLVEFRRIFIDEFAQIKVQYQNNISAAIKAIKAIKTTKSDHRITDKERSNLSIIQQRLSNLEANLVNTSDIYQLDNHYQAIFKDILQLNTKLIQQIELDHAKNYYQQLIYNVREAIHGFYESKKITKKDSNNILDTIDCELDALQDKLFKIDDVNNLDQQYRENVAKFSKLTSENTCSFLKSIINKIFNLLNSVNIHCYRPNVVPNNVQEKLDIMINNQRFFSHAKMVVSSEEINSEAMISKKALLTEP